MKRTLLGLESLSQSFWKGHVVQSRCLQRVERRSRAQDTGSSPPSRGPTSPVTLQPKSSSRRAMPECQVCGRILTNLVSSGVWSLFRTTSVASLLAWKTCNRRCDRAVFEGGAEVLLSFIPFKLKNNQWFCCLGLF